MRIRSGQSFLEREQDYMIVHNHYYAVGLQAGHCSCFQIVDRQLPGGHCSPIRSPRSQQEAAKQLPAENVAELRKVLDASRQQQGAPRCAAMCLTAYRESGSDLKAPRLTPRIPL